MEFDTTVITRNAGLLGQGLVLTLWITGASLLAGMALGLPIAAARMHPRAIAQRAARAYIAFFRTTPELVLIFWAYFCLPPIFGLRLSAPVSGILSLSLVCGAYMAEIFRAGVESVPRGQVEAGRALGLSSLAIWITILLPQAVRRMMPALLNYLTELLKNSTLLAGIGVAELAYQAYTLGAMTYRYMELLSSIAIIFFIVIFPLSLAARGVESRMARRTGH